MGWGRYVRLAIASILAAMLPETGNALDLRLERTTSGKVYVYASGEIVEGDTDRLEVLLHSGRIEDRWIVLDSLGGALLEGMMLGQFFDYFGFTTVVTRADRCLSACFFAFAGGERRWVIEGGQLGVHQFRGGPNDEAYSQYVIATLMDDLRKYGIDPRALTVSLRTPADEMHIFTSDELESFGIVKDGDQGSFDEREALALGISTSEYRKRRAAYLADPVVRRCLSMDKRRADAARQFCLLTTLPAHGLRR